MLSEELAVSAEVVRCRAGKEGDNKSRFWPIWGVGTLSWGKRGRRETRFHLSLRKMTQVGGCRGRIGGNT